LISYITGEFLDFWNLGSLSNLHHLDLAMSKFLDLVICKLSVLLELSLANIVFESTQPEEVIAAGPKCKLLQLTIGRVALFQQREVVRKG